MNHLNSTTYTRSTDFGIDEFNHRLDRAVRGPILGTYSPHARFMVATGGGSAVIECRESTRDGDRLAISITLNRSTPRRMRAFMRRFDRVMGTSEIAIPGGVREAMLSEMGRYSLRPGRIIAAVSG